jgi:hypothetical protein
MAEWAISPWGGVAYLDIRGEELTFSEAERLFEAVEVHHRTHQLKMIIVDARGLDFLPGPVEVLVVGVEAQAGAHGLRVKVRRDETPI